MMKLESANISTKSLLLKYKLEGVKRVRFLASISQRTCNSCIKLNGKLFDIEKALKNLPIPNKRCKNKDEHGHINCRCAIIKQFK